MKNLLFKLTLLGFLSLFFVAFAGKASDEIPYKLAKNYFVRNDYPDKEIHILRIKSQKQFDDIFGAATLMGEEGRPTEIDFSKSDVIALINKSSNDISGMSIRSLTQGRNITLIYSQTQIPVQSYTSRHFCLLIVDKKYSEPLSAMRMEGEYPMLGSDFNEFGCKPSTGYGSWSILKNKCIRIFEEGGKLLEGSTGKLAVIFSDNKKEAELIDFHYRDYPQNVVLKNAPKTKIWKKGNLILSLEKDNYVLRDKKTELAKGK